MKKCSNKKCESKDKLLPFDCFYKRSDVKSGHASQCKKCQKIHYDNHTTENIAYRAKYGAANRYAFAIRQVKYRKNNKEKVAVAQALYRKQKYEDDPLFRLESILRGRIRMAIKTQGTSKAYKSLELLGCTPTFAKSYIESRWKPGMSWDNYGIKGWHIDHIRPCASFDLSDPEQQKQCFHYTNLQPLWAQENLSKGSRFISINL